MKPVRVRGVGLVSAYGNGVAPAVAGMRSGRDSIGALSLFPVAFADRIKINQLDHRALPTGEALASHLMAQAIDEALARGGVAAPLRDCALLVGTTGFLFTAESQGRADHARTGTMPTPVLPVTGRIVAQLARAYGIDGPVMTFSTACSSSANALIVAQEMLASGRVRRALAVGVEGLSAVSVGGFYALMLLDPEGCRPFDARRRGLQLGEGAAALLLDTDSAAAAPILRGGANLCDIHHVTSASPDGAAMRTVMTAALARAGVGTRDIVVIKSHGTGSDDNDRAEAAAMQGVFGANVPPFTALKRYFGHTLGACGAIETAALLACVDAGFIPAAAGFAEADPQLGLTPLAASQPAPRGHYLYNFFGFGGNYASYVITHE